MSKDPRQSVTIADALMYPRHTGRARFSETVIASLIADKTSAGKVRVVAVVGGKRKEFTGMRAVRMRTMLRQLEAACASPEGDRRG